MKVMALLGLLAASMLCYTGIAAQTLAPAKSGDPAGANGPEVPAGQQMPDFLKSALEGVKARAGAQGQAKPASRDPRCDLAIGTWRGLGLEPIKLDQDGTAQSRSRRGAWQCLDAAQRRIAIDLAGSGRLTLTIDPAGDRANARDPTQRLMVAYKEQATKALPSHPAIAERANNCNGIAGHWLWTDGAKLTLNADGRVLSDKGPGGTWQCQDAKTTRIGVTFPGQPEIALTLDPKTGHLDGKDAAGWPLSVGRRQ